MKHGITAIVLALVATCTSVAQTASDLNEGAKITYDEITDTFSFDWWGVDGRSYFIQQSDDLSHWIYIPEIESGADAILGYGFQTTAERLFLRLRYTDIPTEDPSLADFDGDGIGNQAELNAGLDPFAPDTDGDGMRDDWELLHGLNPLVNDASGDLDSDEVDNLTEFLLETNPSQSIEEVSPATLGLKVHTPLLQ